MLKWIATCFLTGVFNLLWAQSSQTLFVVRGCLVDSVDRPVFNSQIRIREGYTGRLLFYRVLGKDSCFNISFSLNKPDSAVLIISHPALQHPGILLRFEGDGVLDIGKVRMQTDPSLLPNVTVQTAPVWVRGDTTFFAADFFREGNEKKLRELLEKMPDFSLDQKGNLLYKKRRIEKLMIEGESIMGENVKLLINSIPVHVIQTVQVLDNQNQNKLMKGLSGDNSLFLNIGLKKDRLAGSFGDLETGVGSEKMYQLAPSFFLLNNKIKAGFAGNNNNTGAGFDWGDESDIRPTALNEDAAGMMNEQMLQLVNNFPGRRYISNRRFSNHLQVNYSISKQVKASTRLEQLADKQRQQSLFESNILTDSGYLFRQEDRAIRQLPTHWRLAQNLSWALGSKKLLRIDLQYYRFTNSAKQTVQVNDFSGTNTSENQIRSRTSFLQTDIEFTHRIAENKAIRFYFNSSLAQLQQKADAYWNNWPIYFNLPDPSLNRLYQPFGQNLSVVQTGFNLIRKSKRPVWQHGLQLSQQSRQLENPVEFRSTNASANAYPYPDLSGYGKYPLVQLLGKSVISQSVSKNMLRLELEYGWAWNKVNEGASEVNHNFPMAQLLASFRSPVSDGWFYNVTFNIQQKPFSWQQMAQAIYPQTATSFQQNIYNGMPQQEAGFQAVLNKRIGRITRKGYSSLMLFGNYKTFFRSPVFASNVQAVYQLYTDSVTRRTTQNWSSNLVYSVKRLSSNVDIQVGLGYSQAQSIMIVDGELTDFHTDWWNTSLVASKKWKQVSTTELRYFGNLNFIPSSIGIKSNLKRSIWGHRVIVSQDYSGLKNNRFRLSGEWYANSSPFNTIRSLIFIDLEWTYRFKNSSWMLSFLLGNIANESNYYSQNNSPLRQDFFQLPLIPRNLFLSVRREL